MRKTFCISFHKTGTTSLHKYLLASGITSCHGPHVVDGIDYMEKVRAVQDDPEGVVGVLEPVIAKFDAHCDVPYPGIYRELSARYPDARFIFLRRDPEQWWASVSAQWSLALFRHELSPFEYVQYRPYAEGMKSVGLEDRDRLLLAYQRHEDAVRRDLREMDVLYCDLDDPQKANKLAEFLGATAGREFPHAKRTTLRRISKQLIKNAKRRLGTQGWAR